MTHSSAVTSDGTATLMVAFVVSVCVSSRRAAGVGMRADQVESGEVAAGGEKREARRASVSIAIGTCLRPTFDPVRPRSVDATGGGFGIVPLSSSSSSSSSSSFSFIKEEKPHARRARGGRAVTRVRTNARGAQLRRSGGNRDAVFRHPPLRGMFLRPPPPRGGGGNYTTMFQLTTLV